MLKKVSLKENEVVCVKLDEALYTLAQMRANGIMQFFDISREDPHWPPVDLNTVPSLFYIFVADKAISTIFLEKLPPAVAIPSAEPIPKAMLSAIIGNGTYGAKLIELTERFSALGGRLLKDRLDPIEDWKIIYKHEMAGMHTDPEKLRQRLLRYFQTGVDWDDTKSFIFKDIRLPHPGEPKI